MKKIVVVLGVLASVLFASCESDSVNTEIYEVEKKLIDTSEDGKVDPGDDDEY